MNTLTATYGHQKRWVNWKMLTRDGKTTKVPIGESDNPDTWSILADLPDQDNIGIMFGTKKLLLGIDIDKCLEDGKIVGKNAVEISMLLSNANTYCEISPSGTGLHLFLDLEEPMDLKANRKGGYECYTTGRYFTVTKNPFGVEKPVRTVNVAEAEMLLALIGYPWKKDSLQAPAQRQPSADLVPSDDADLLKIMFKAKNGSAIKALYDGDISAYGTDQSVGDMAFLSHLAFYCQGNPDQMERIWLSSPIGSREKTQSRNDYRKRSILNAVAQTSEFYKPKTKKDTVKIIVDDEEKEIDLDLLFTLDKDGNKRYTMNTENIVRVLRKHPEFAGKLRFDAFKNRIEMRKGNSWKEIEDNDQVFVQTKISVVLPFFQKVSKIMVTDAMLFVCKENEIDSAADWIRSINWDGESRLDKWLHFAFGTPDDNYHAKVGSNWIKGMVNRIIHPGCKFDYVIVLEGAQGTKKSSSLAALGGAWHFETSEGIDNKDFFQQFEGKAIVEFSEGETLSRTEVKRMKAIITTQIDRYRPSYGRFSMDFPRRCVFAMTTNAEEYLKDETGNRRWLPVRVLKSEADVQWILDNREQMFAEALHRLVELKETTWEFPSDEMLEAQNQRRIHDPNNDAVEEWYMHLELEDKKKGITVHQVHKGALNGNFTTKMTRSDEMSIAAILRDHMKFEKRQNMTNGIRATRWYEPEYVPGMPGNLIDPNAPVKALSLSDF